MIPSSRHPATSPTTRLVEEFLAAWNAHDISRAASLHAPDFEGVDVGRAGSYFGRRGASELMAECLEAFPDIAIECEEVVAEGDLIAIVWTARGTHEGGNLMRIPPTNRAIRVRGVSMLTVGEAGISRALYVWDTAGLLRNIGLLPEL